MNGIDTQRQQMDAGCPRPRTLAVLNVGLRVLSAELADNDDDTERDIYSA